MKRRKRLPMPYKEWRRDIQKWLERFDQCATDKTTVAYWCIKINHGSEGIARSEIVGPIFQTGEVPANESALPTLASFAGRYPDATLGED